MSVIKKGLNTVFLAELINGMWLTLKYMFKKKVTINYPYEKNFLSPQIKQNIFLFWLFGSLD